MADGTVQMHAVQVVQLIGRRGGHQGRAFRRATWRSRTASFACPRSQGGNHAPSTQPGSGAARAGRFQVMHADERWERGSGSGEPTNAPRFWFHRPAPCSRLFAPPSPPPPPALFHPPARHDHAGHGGHPALRHHGLPATAGERPAQRRFPHHSGQRRPARRQPRNHGLGRGHAAGETVLDHRRPRLDGLHVSVLGSTQITLQFSLSRNLDAAAQDVQAAIAAAARQLPPNMPTPPSYNKVNPADQPILLPGPHSPTLPL